MKRVLAKTLGFVMLLGQSPKPPVAKYDPQRDVTTYSTGDIQTAGYSGYGAQFEFPGKTPTTPSSVGMGFGALRLTHDRPPEGDRAALHWTDVKTISVTFGGKTREYPAVHAFNVSKDRRVTMFLGRGLEESMAITLTVAEFRDLAAADSISVQLGKDTQLIKGKSLVALKRLSACLP